MNARSAWPLAFAFTACGSPGETGDSDAGDRQAPGAALVLVVDEGAACPWSGAVVDVGGFGTVERGTRGISDGDGVDAVGCRVAKDESGFTVHAQLDTDHALALGATSRGPLSFVLDGDAARAAVAITWSGSTVRGEACALEIGDIEPGRIWARFTCAAEACHVAGRFVFEACDR